MVGQLIAPFSSKLSSCLLSTLQTSTKPLDMSLATEDIAHAPWTAMDWQKVAIFAGVACGSFLALVALLVLMHCLRHARGRRARDRHQPQMERTRHPLPWDVEAQASLSRPEPAHVRPERLSKETSSYSEPPPAYTSRERLTE